MKYSLDRIFIFLIINLLITSVALAQSPWASRVVDHQFGTSQTFGQDSAFFPANVIGPFEAAAGPFTPAASQDAVCSLGKGGYITLGFEAPIVDDPGADFTVFENCFRYTNGSGTFEEWMIVSVSADSVNWHTFAYDSITGQGLAGRTPPAEAPVNYQDPAVSGGDAFDIAALGLDSVRFVRLTDATHFQPADRLSADLDAVTAVHMLGTSSRQQEITNRRRLRTFRQGNVTHLQADRPLDILTIFSPDGRSIASFRNLHAAERARLPETAAGMLLARSFDGKRWHSERILIR